MTLNTFKTVVGFLMTMISKYTPLKLGKNSLDAVYNYHVISERIVTSGQPNEAQFLSIRDAGFQSVINLAPHNAENSLVDEASLLNQLGLKYHHIPVNFKQPTKSDFEKFVTLMNASQQEKIWVHCAANMRVSAFIYKYRCEVLNEDEEIAKADLTQIWEPFGVWKEFISKAI